MTDNNYEPSRDVQAANHMPHLNSHLQAAPGEFNFSYSYFLSLVPFPAIILSLFLALLLGFAFTILFRGVYNYCCACNCNKPGELEAERLRESVVVRAVKKVTGRTGIFRTYLVALFCLIFVTCFIWLANARVGKAFVDVSNATTDITNVFDGIVAAANDIVTYTDTMTATLNSAACTVPPYEEPTIKAIAVNSTVIAAFANSINSIASPVNGALNTFVTSVEDVAVNKKTLVVGVFFGLVMGVSVVFASASFFRKTFLFRVAIFMSWWILLAMTFIATVMMVLVMGMSDFCMDPSGNILQSLTAGSSLYQILSFFLTCSGTNPFQSNINSLNSTVIYMEKELKEYKAYLPVPCYNTLSAQCSLITVQANVIEQDLTCAPLYNAWSTAIYSGMCKDGFGAVYAVMIVMYLMIVFLYIVMAVANALYYKYGYDDVHVDIEAAINAMHARRSDNSTAGKVTGVAFLTGMPSASDQAAATGSEPHLGTGAGAGGDVNSKWWVDVEASSTSPMGKENGDGAVLHHDEL